MVMPLPRLVFSPGFRMHGRGNGRRDFRDYSVGRRRVVKVVGVR
jgi:hypothetical protein